MYMTMSGVDFLKRPHAPAPLRIVNQARARQGVPERCAYANNSIPRLYPRTNGMTQCFNGPISDPLQQTRLKLTVEPETALMRYAEEQSHHISATHAQ